MDIKEKENAVKVIMDILMGNNHPDNPSQSAVELIVKLPTLLEDIWNKGRMEGFKEGYKEAKRKLEKEQSKFN